VGAAEYELHKKPGGSAQETNGHLTPISRSCAKPGASSHPEGPRRPPLALPEEDVPGDAQRQGAAAVLGWVACCWLAVGHNNSLRRPANRSIKDPVKTQARRWVTLPWSTDRFEREAKAARLSPSPPVARTTCRLEFRLGPVHHLIDPIPSTTIPALGRPAGLPMTPFENGGARFREAAVRRRACSHCSAVILSNFYEVTRAEIYCSALDLSPRLPLISSFDPQLIRSVQNTRISRRNERSIKMAVAASGCA